MTRLALLLCLCFAGCIRVPVTPGPGPTPEPAADTEMDRWLESLRETTFKALEDTESAVKADRTDNEQLYRNELGKNLEMAAKAARVELAQNDKKLSDSGYTREKALEIIARRKRELRRGQ